MPLVKCWRKIYQIPFDPDNIASLLYQGYEVGSDEGTPNLWDTVKYEGSYG